MAKSYFKNFKEVPLHSFIIQTLFLIKENKINNSYPKPRRKITRTKLIHKMFKILLLLSFAFISAFATLGFDISSFQGAPDQSVFDCLKAQGNEFAILQLWRGGPGINEYFAENYRKTKAAGISKVDAYAFFCNNCTGNTPTNICSSIKSNLPEGFDGLIWLDIEDCKGCWKGTPNERLSFVMLVAITCATKGLKLGVYSGHGSWEQVFGSADFDAQGLKGLPLWYAHYDGVQDYSDWETIKFGGWKAPVMKQYLGGKPICGTTADSNFKESQSNDEVIIY